MKNAKKFLIAIFMFAFVMPLLLTGCKGDKSIKIWQEDGISEVKRGQELVINITPTKIDLSSIDFQVEGSAVITNDGKLTIAQNATVGSEIKVTATSETDKVTSNELTFVVVDLMPTAIGITTSAEVLTKNSTITLGTTTTPDFATVNEVTYSIDQTEIAEIVDGVLKIKADADEELLKTEKTITITAKLTADPTISTTKSVKYTIAPKLASIMAGTSVVDIYHSATPTLEFVPVNEDLIELDMDNNNFTYSSSDPSVATISSDGKIEAHKHGATKVTITYIDDQQITTDCMVYIVATPNAITFDNTKTSAHIFDTKELYYSKNDTNLLKLDLIGTDFEGVKTSQKFKYSFSNKNNDPSNTIATADNDGKITFLKTGDIQVRVESDSSIEGLDTLPDTLSEKVFKCTVHVNEGVNIRTVSQLKDFANNSELTTANILCNLSMDAQNNFDDTTPNGISCYQGLEFTGDRYIFGNGYKFTTENMPFNPDSSGKGNDLFTFKRKTDNVPFTVQIRDWSIFGATTVNGTHTIKTNTSAIHGEGNKTQVVYNRGIWIKGDEVEKNDTGSRAYVKDMLIENVEIANFYVGLRISHATSTNEYTSTLSNLHIRDCFGNGLESVQNIMTLKNIKLGKVGAFGIEVTSDDLVANNNDIDCKSGINYNQPQKITFEGTIDSDNYNNGSETPYIIGLNKQLGMTFVEMLNAITLGNISTVKEALNLTTQQEDQLKATANAVMKNKDNKINLYMLIFRNPVDFPAYTQGNMATKGQPTDIYHEGKFLEFAEGTSDIINLTYLLSYISSNSSWDGYKAYKYIQMDLPTGSDMGNIGQVLLVNQAYDPNYVSNNA